MLSAMQAIAALKDTDYTLIPLYITKSGKWLTGEYLLDLEHYQDLDELEQQAIPCTFSHNTMGKPVLLETEKRGLFSSRHSHPVYAVLPAFHGSEGETVRSRERVICTICPLPAAACWPQAWGWTR
ncbi:MAG: hypothetical protein U5K69_29760 [Balneolaceae bacterium]|nr:hypothetical protein [Balneolaceae bacterium]